MTKFTEDPSRECDNMVMQGVQHKYPETLVLLVTNKCFKHCAHCFRKRNFDREDEVCTDYAAVRQYIRDHDEITNVLLTGGDPITLPVATIGSICKEVYVNNINIIRIGTSALTYSPESLFRFMGVFHAYGIQLIAHVNRIDELGCVEAAVTLSKLRQEGILIRSQTVLLRGTNDNVLTLVFLFRGLVKLGIFPYYLFQCRPVVGNEDFVVPLLEGMQLVNEVRHKLSGLEKTFRFIMSTTDGKLEALGIIGGRNLMYRFHQAKHPAYRNRLFVELLTDKSVWCRGENVKPFRETLIES